MRVSKSFGASPADPNKALSFTKSQEECLALFPGLPLAEDELMIILLKV